jgi:predicted GNAT family acetyltransferase
MSDVQTTDNTEQHRYEARVDGELAGFAEYRVRGERVVFTHTEVDDAYEGQGIGSALARTALDEVRAAGRRAVPQCPFIRSWIDRHPEYADLVAG